MTARNRLSKPASYVLGRRYRERQTMRWKPEEDMVIREAVLANLTLDETHMLLPHRTRDSVRDRYYRAREPLNRDGGLDSVRRQKDAKEGSARLLEAMLRAHPNVDRDGNPVCEQRKVG